MVLLDQRRLPDEVVELTCTTAAEVAEAIQVLAVRGAPAIGTYSLGVLAAHHDIPLYVVAPTSTVDLATPTGAEIPIEERASEEITTRFRARNPAFDVTPGALIAAIVTEAGIHRAPYAESLAALV